MNQNARIQLTIVGGDSEAYRHWSRAHAHTAESQSASWEAARSISNAFETHLYVAPLRQTASFSRAATTRACANVNSSSSSPSASTSLSCPSAAVISALLLAFAVPVRLCESPTAYRGVSIEADTADAVTVLQAYLVILLRHDIFTSCESDSRIGAVLIHLIVL